MRMYYETPTIPLYNGFYLFPLPLAVNSNRLIFDPSEVEIHQYQTFALDSVVKAELFSSQGGSLTIAIYHRKEINGICLNPNHCDPTSVFARQKQRLI